jgi:hypothetical protein
MERGRSGLYRKVLAGEANLASVASAEIFLENLFQTYLISKVLFGLGKG